MSAGLTAQATFVFSKPYKLFFFEPLFLFIGDRSLLSYNWWRLVLFFRGGDGCLEIYLFGTPGDEVGNFASSSSLVTSNVVYVGCKAV